MPRLKFVVAGTIIIGTVSYLMFSGINDSMVYYYTVSEMFDRIPEVSGTGIRVSGHVSPGTIRKDTERSQVEFLVFEKDDDHVLPVIYQGIIPDTFKDNAEVVVEGTYSSEKKRFQATVLLAKCPSKYQALEEQHPEDIPISQESYQ